MSYDAPIRTAAFLSSHLIRGVGNGGDIHDSREIEAHGHRAYISADKVTLSYTVQMMEKVVGVSLKEVDLIVLHVDPGIGISVSEFKRAGIPGEKVMYAMCKCYLAELEDFVRIHHPGAHAVEVNCGVGPMFGHLIRRFLATGTVHKHSGSRHQVTRAY